MIDFQRVTALLATATLISACAATQKSVEAPAAPPAKPQAVSKMVEGVQSARDATGKERAIGLLNDAVSADPALWEAHYNLGVLLADKGELKTAERELTEAARLAPNAEDVVVALAEVRRRTGDAAGAIDALQAFVAHNPDSRVAPTALITAFREGGQVRQAIEQAQRVLVHHAKDSFALSELALANVELGEIDAAELLIDEALKADERSAVAERAAGLVFLRKGDDALAFKHFQRESELDPRDTTAHLNIGTVLLRAGVYDRAAQEFRAVLGIDPSNVDATLGLAAARRGQGKREDQSGYLEAERLLKGILDREPNLDATFNLALLYRNYLKRPAEASPLLQRFLANAPKTHPGRPEAERLSSGLQGSKN